MKFNLAILWLCTAASLSAAELKPEKAYFRPHEKFRLDARDKNNGKTDLQVRDFHGAIRRIDPGTMLLPTDKNGYFELILNGKTVTSYVVVPKPPERNTEKNPFGVNFHLLRGGYGNAAREVELAKFIGIDWGRGMLPSFSSMRSSDFEDGFKQWRNYIDLARKSGIHPLCTLIDFPVYLYGKKWNRPLSLTAPEDMNCVTEFCKAAAKEMPFVKHWEIGNETDSESFWLGRKSSEGNDRKIIQDYIDLLAAAKKGFERTEVKIHYSGVTSYKEGASYRPFLTTTMELGAQKYCDYMGTHYNGDIPYLRSVMKKFNAPELPVWVTEIGTSAYSPALNDFSQKRQLRTDVIQQIEQLADGAEKVFKYNFRDKGIKKNDLESNFGLIRHDFSPKPNYVAEATLIRMLANAVFSGGMNLMKHCSSGWLKAFLFKENGKEITVVWLNDAPKATVSLQTEEPELFLIDIMGNTRKIAVRDQKASFETDDLPFFIIGKLRPDKGNPSYPEEKLLKTFHMPLKNSGFESPDLSVWDAKPLTGDMKNSSKLKLTRSPAGAFKGKFSLDAEITTPAGFYVPVISQTFDLADIRKQMKDGDYLTFKAGCMMKRDISTGRGSSFEVSCIDGKKRRIKWYSNGYRNGRHDWTEQQPALNRIPEPTRFLTVHCFFAPDTAGKFSVDEVRLTVELRGKDTEQQIIPNF